MSRTASDHREGTLTNDLALMVIDPPIEPRMILIAPRECATLLPAAQQFVRIAKLECRKRLSRPAR